MPNTEYPDTDGTDRNLSSQTHINRACSHRLDIVGTGIQSLAHLTPVAQHAIQHADLVLYAVADPLTVRHIQDLAQGECRPFSYPRDDSQRRDTYAAMAAEALSALQNKSKVCAVFYGHPAVLSSPTHLLYRRAQSAGFAAKILPGVSSLDCMYADLGIDPGSGGCQIYEATDLLTHQFAIETRVRLILCQIAMVRNTSFFGSNKIHSPRDGLLELANYLRRSYPNSHSLTLYEANALPTFPPTIHTLTLGDLEHQPVTELMTMLVPPLRVNAP